MSSYLGKTGFLSRIFFPGLVFSREMGLRVSAFLWDTSLTDLMRQIKLRGDVA